MTGGTNTNAGRRRRSIARMAFRLIIAIAALAAAVEAVVMALFVDTLRRYGL
jgi:hypothetical protein